MNTIITIILTAIGSAGFMSLIQFLINRHDKKKESNGTEREALRYLMLYIIEDTASKIIPKKEITLQQKQMLKKWYTLYHDGLGGNGDASLVMDIINGLPVKT